MCTESPSNYLATILNGSAECSVFLAFARSLIENDFLKYLTILVSRILVENFSEKLGEKIEISPTLPCCFRIPKPIVILQFFKVFYG